MSFGDYGTKWDRYAPRSSFCVVCGELDEIMKRCDNCERSMCPQCYRYGFLCVDCEALEAEAETDEDRQGRIEHGQ